MSEKKKNMLLQGGILAGAGLITKIIGFAYRIPMSNMMGEETFIWKEMDGLGEW